MKYDLDRIIDREGTGSVKWEIYRGGSNAGPITPVDTSLTSDGPTIINCSGAAAKPATRLHSRRGAPAEKAGTACMPSWRTSSKQGELGVWLVLVVNGREALETHSFQVVLEFIERPADSAQLQGGGALGWTLHEADFNLWGCLMIFVAGFSDKYQQHASTYGEQTILQTRAPLPLGRCNRGQRV